MILIVSLSAKNIHKSLAPWCLISAAQDRDVDVFESDINENIMEIINGVFERHPKAVVFSCYIWNITLIEKIASELKKLMPDCIFAAGGPEVSFRDTVPTPFDCIIKGGEYSFIKFADMVLNNDKIERGSFIYEDNPPFSELPSPYTEKYFLSFKNGKMKDIKNQLVYYESSRGCRYGCTYCLSSAEQKLEFLPIERVKKELLTIIGEGASCIKFTDRTFNADPLRAEEILNFIKDLETDCTFHFEAGGDLFSERMLDIIKQMPPARVQFEIGIQTITDASLEAVHRKTSFAKLTYAVNRLISFGNCHIHLDLIAGLPKDSYDGINKSLDYCLSLKPHMLQLGFLKLLRGSKLCNDTEGIVFLNEPPYEVLYSDGFNFMELNRLRKIALILDKFYNSGIYINSIRYAQTLFERPSAMLYALNDFAEGRRIRSMSQKDSYAFLYEFMLRYGEKQKAEHYLKLDMLSFDPKGRYSLHEHRDKDAEDIYKKQTGSKNVRAEYFPYDGTIKIFDYRHKDPVTKSYFAGDFKEIID